MKLDFKKISKLLPEDFFRAVRDISLLNCSVFGEFYAIAVKEKFGVGLSVTFWSIKDRQIVFYRSEKENTKFSRKLAEHYKKDENYAKNLAKKLIKKTDWFNNFLAKNKSFKDFKKSAKVFFDNYKEFFALHQAIYWGGNYLSKLKASDKEKKKVNRIIEILNSAYKYNEMVIPNIEKYFKRLKISNFLYDEIVKNIKTKPKRRSLLFVKNKRFILSNKEASKLEKIIEEKIKKSCEFVKGIKGLAVTKGKYRGRVR